MRSMNNGRLFVILLLVTFSCGVTSASAPEPELARQWAGTYTYHSNFDVDYFQVTLDKVVAEDDYIHAFGAARYFSNSGNYVANLRVEWTIEKSTRFIQIMDVAAADDGGEYDTSGSYSGSISRKLNSIIAIYRGQYSGSGTLKLEAVDTFPDYSKYIRKKAEP